MGRRERTLSTPPPRASRGTDNSVQSRMWSKKPFSSSSSATPAPEAEAAAGVELGLGRLPPDKRCSAAGLNMVGMEDVQSWLRLMSRKLESPPTPPTLSFPSMLRPAPKMPRERAKGRENIWAASGDTASSSSSSSSSMSTFASTMGHSTASLGGDGVGKKSRVDRLLRSAEVRRRGAEGSLTKKRCAEDTSHARGEACRRERSRRRKGKTNGCDERVGRNEGTNKVREDKQVHDRFPSIRC